jgi:hypothetical protein
MTEEDDRGSCLWTGWNRAVDMENRRAMLQTVLVQNRGPSLGAA